jgi:hypothetical protein
MMVFLLLYVKTNFLFLIHERFKDLDSGLKDMLIPDEENWEYPKEITSIEVDNK